MRRRQCPYRPRAKYSHLWLCAPQCTLDDGEEEEEAVEEGEDNTYMVCTMFQVPFKALPTYELIYSHHHSKQ